VVQDEPVNTGSDRWSNAPPSRACNLAMSGSPRQRRSGSTRCATAGGPDLTLGVPGETGFEGEPFSLRSGDRSCFRRVAGQYPVAADPGTHGVHAHGSLFTTVTSWAAAVSDPVVRPGAGRRGPCGVRLEAMTHAPCMHKASTSAPRWRSSTPDLTSDWGVHQTDSPNRRRTALHDSAERDQAYSCCGGASTMPKSTWSARNTSRSTGRICRA